MAKTPRKSRLPRIGTSFWKDEFSGLLPENFLRLEEALGTPINENGRKYIDAQCREFLANHISEKKAPKQRDVVAYLNDLRSHVDDLYKLLKDGRAQGLSREQLIHVRSEVSIDTDLNISKLSDDLQRLRGTLNQTIRRIESVSGIVEGDAEGLFVFRLHEKFLDPKSIDRKEKYSLGEKSPFTDFMKVMFSSFNPMQYTPKPEVDGKAIAKRLTRASNHGRQLTELKGKRSSN